MAAIDALTLVWLRDQLASGKAQQARQRARLSQSEVADAIGVTQSAVGLWEQGRRLPRGVAALRYAALLRELRETPEARTEVPA